MTPTVAATLTSSRRVAEMIIRTPTMHDYLNSLSEAIEARAGEPVDAKFLAYFCSCSVEYAEKILQVAEGNRIVEARNKHLASLSLSNG